MKPSLIIVKTKLFNRGIYFFVILIFIFLGISCENSDKINKISLLTDEEINRFLQQEYFEVPVSEQVIANFKFKILDGKQETMLENRGKVILLNFWAVWCHPCKVEMPDIEELKNIMQKEDFRILTVDYGDSSQKVRNYINQHDYTFDVIIDHESTISKTIGITGLPTTLIIDKNGRVRGKIMGPKKWKSNEMVRMLKSLSQ